MTALAERWGWWSIPASIVFWTLFWWLAPVLLVLWLVRRHRALDRVERLRLWYPPAWRERHGADLAELLHDTIEDGRDGPLMSLNVAFEGIAVRLDGVSARLVIAALCWWLAGIAILAQGVVPLILMAVDASNRLWFLALYMPSPLGPFTALAMIGLGLLLLLAALRLTLGPRFRTALDGLDFKLS